MEDNYSDSFEESSKQATITNTGLGLGGNALGANKGGYGGGSKPFTLEEDEDDKSLDFGDVAKPEPKKNEKASDDGGDDYEDDDYEEDDFDDEEEEMFKRTATEFANKLQELQANNKLLDEARAKDEGIRAKKAAALPAYVPPKANMSMPMTEAPKQAKAAALP